MFMPFAPCPGILSAIFSCYDSGVGKYIEFEFTTLVYENIFIQISKIDFFYFKTSYIFFITKFKNIKCHYLFLSTYFATVLS